MRYLLVLFLLLTPVQDTVVVPIQNPSFEQRTGWKFGAGSRIESGHALAGYGSSFSQDLGMSPATLQAMPGKPGYHVEGTYVLKFSVANYFPSYPGYYEAKITFGTQELCEITGWATRTSSQVTLTCPSPGYLIVDKALPEGGPVQGQQNIEFTVTGQGWTLLFDNFSMEFTPNQ